MIDYSEIEVILKRIPYGRRSTSDVLKYLNRELEEWDMVFFHEWQKDYQEDEIQIRKFVFSENKLLVCLLSSSYMGGTTFISEQFVYEFIQALIVATETGESA